MEQGKFTLTIAGLVGLLLLATSPLGAMMGFLLGVTVAFFVAPFLWMLAGALGTDLNTIMQPTMITLGVLYGAWALAVVAMLVAALRSSDMNRARLHAATLAFIVAAPLTLWLSAEALVDAWP